MCLTIKISVKFDFNMNLIIHLIYYNTHNDYIQNDNTDMTQLLGHGLGNY